MTDLEITRLCAEAIGYMFIHYDNTTPRAKHPESAQRVCIGKKAFFWFDPLHNDAQAMALVKKFPAKCVFAMTKHFVDFQPDTYNFNRAICECVAKMQKDKK